MKHYVTQAGKGLMASEAENTWHIADNVLT